MTITLGVKRCATALLLLIPTLAIGASENDASYRISIPESDTRVATVEAWLQPVDTAFYMFPGAEQFPARWATFVSDVEVTNQDGDELTMIAMDDGTWRLDSIPEAPIRLRYQVNLDHDRHEWSSGIDGAAYARDWGVFYTTRSLFIVNGEDRSNVTIDFQLPPDWKITTPWATRPDSASTYSIPSQSALENSILFAGTHREVEVRNGTFELLLALGGESVLEREDEFVGMAKAVLDYYAELMGGTPRLPGDGANDLPVVVINESDVTDGEALGNNISILLQPGGDPMSDMIARMIFAHEFFHLWNGKSFAPAGSDGEWIKEGFSNLYTLKALRHTGYLSEEACLNVLGSFFYPRYDSDPAVGTHSITEGSLKHDHWGLIYVGGMLVAIAQDARIRTATDNHHSLDDLMRYLFDNFSQNAYSVADVERLLGDLAGTGQSEFFERHVYGTERIPIKSLMDTANIEARQENGQWQFTALGESALSPCYAAR